MPTRRKATYAVALMTCLVLSSVKTACAQSTQPVYVFHAFTGADGSRPSVLLQGSDGNFYGATSRGGANASGAVYKITGDSAFTLLYSFSALIFHPGGGLADPSETNADGAAPAGLARDGSGTLWGIASGGGANGNGTLFRIAPGGAFSVVHTFGRYQLKTVTAPGSGGTTATYSILVNPDGARPSNLTLGRDGNLYGMTSGGGPNGNGTIFKVTPGGGFTTFYTFSQTHLRPGSAIPSENPNDFLNTDGAAPEGVPLVSGKDGSLYGMTSEGGPDGLGTIFKITLSGAFSVLGAPGNGYVATSAGGIVNGSQTFSSTFERFPVSMILGADGNFYGTLGSHLIGINQIAIGGIAAFTGGSVFRMTPTGSTTTLFAFPNTFLPHPQNYIAPPDGADPSSLAFGGDGHLYGTTRAGATNGAGTIFRLSPDPASSTGYSPKTLYVPVVDGAEPTNLLLASDGNLYGTGDGGVNGSGVVFEVAPTPSPFLLHSFAGPEGRDPVSLLQGKDGNLYGATRASTLPGVNGTLFMLTTDSTPAHDTLKVLHNLGNLEPSSLNTGLIQASDGLFYGTSVSGVGAGSIFKFTAGGLLTDLYGFPGGGSAIGGTLFGGVIEGPGGKFYGTTGAGGTNGTGTAYSFVPGAAAPTVLHTFVYQNNGLNSNGSPKPDDGDTPQGNLLLASDGKLYGVTQRGGHDPNSGEGVIYRLDPHAPAPGYGFQVLHRFDPATEGGNSPGALVEGKDGALYGTTGVFYYQPTVFKINKDGSGFHILHALTFSEGSGAATPLLLAKDGNFYGMIGAGGGGGGSIYRITPAGDFRTVYRFSGPDGEDHYNGNFVAALVQASDGELYGVAGSGGLFGYNFNEPYIDGFGTIFRLAIARPKSQAAAAAKNATGQITLNYKGQTFVAGVHTYAFTLTNTGGALAGPIALVLDNLPSGAKLLNAGGNTNATTPSGSPYVLVTSGGLAAGATSGSVLLKLTTPLTNAIGRRVLSGPGAF